MGGELKGEPTEGRVRGSGANQKNGGFTFNERWEGGLAEMRKAIGTERRAGACLNKNGKTRDREEGGGPPKPERILTFPKGRRHQSARYLGEGKRRVT